MCIKKTETARHVINDNSNNVNYCNLKVKRYKYIHTENIYNVSYNEH